MRALHVHYDYTLTIMRPMTLLFVVTALCCTEPVSSVLAPSQLEALHALYDATGGDNWEWRDPRIYGPVWNFSTGYGGDSDPCDDGWQGVGCWAGDPAYIRNISLPAYGMAGPLPAGALSSLYTINSFEVNDNALSGSVPSSLADMTALEVLLLTKNSFGGSVPTALGALTTLTAFSVRQNALTGSIPSSVAAWTGLQVLDMAENSMAGPLPDFSLLVNMRELRLERNGFSGPFPDGVFGMRWLETFTLGSNSLRGEIPDSAAWAGLSRLSSLSLGHNSFEGSIPAGIGLLGDLTYLDLSFTSFSPGSIPSSYYQLYNLSGLFLPEVNLEGSISSDIGGLSKLKTLVLSGNKLTGTLPPELGALLMLELMFIADNKLKGHIPSDLFSHEENVHFQAIDLSSNALSGSLPESLFLLRTLTSVSLGVNCFRGEIPKTLCTATSLQVLLLDGLTSGAGCAQNIPFSESVFIRFMEGTLPSCVLNLANLETFHFSGNGIEGEIPEYAQASGKLKDLSLSYNRLTGTLPFTVQHAPLDTLDVSYNTIQGSIGHLENYSSLKLVYNRFSGKLPHSVAGGVVISEIDILDGNLFQCSEADLPKEDPSYSSYTCDASEIQISLLTCTGSILAIGFLGVCVAYVSLSKRASKAGEDHTKKGIILRWMHGMVDKVYVTVNAITTYSNIAASIMEPHSRLPKVRAFMLIQETICNVVISVGAFILFLCGPVYVAFKLTGSKETGYPTYEDQNNWLLSCVFLAGVWAAVVIICLWFSVLVLLLFLSPLMAVVEATSLWKYVKSQGGRNKSCGSANANIRGGSDVNIAEEEWMAWLRLEELQVYFRFISFLLVNAVVVSLVNVLYIAYVYIENQRFYLTLVQLAFGGFRLFWNVLVLKLVSIFEKQYDAYLAHFSAVLCFVLVFNNILVPCLASAFSDRNCLQAAFVPPNDIEVSYSFTLCRDYNIDHTECHQSLVLGPFRQQYAPPFIYHYNCASSVLANYIPVLLYTYAFLSLVYPFGMLFISQLNPVTHIPPFVRSLFPRLLWPPFSSKEVVAKNHDLFPASKLLVMSLNHVAVLFTFGFTSPPLALTIIVSIIASVKLWRVLIGRYVVISPDCHFDHGQNDDDLCQRDTLEGRNVSMNVEQGSIISADDSLIVGGEDSTGVGRPTIAELNFTDISGGLSSSCDGCQSGYAMCIWTIVWTSALFFSCIFFDMVGNSEGYVSAIYVFSVTNIVPAFLYFVLWMLGRSSPHLPPVYPSPLTRVSRGTRDTLVALGLRRSTTSAAVIHKREESPAHRESEMVTCQNPIISGIQK